MLFKRVISRFHSHYLSSPEANTNLLRQFGIINPIIYRNLTYSFVTNRVPEYYERGVNFQPSDAQTRTNSLTDSGAFVAYSGKNTGYIITLFSRVPKAKSFVNDPIR